MYAIIATGGKQYTVSEGDVIKVEKLGVNAGDTVTFDQVLFVNDGDAKVGNSSRSFSYSKRYWRRKRQKGYRLQVQEKNWLP
mgnify:CR=1 FL=1